jgi:hypothetical protein
LSAVPLGADTLTPISIPDRTAPPRSFPDIVRFYERLTFYEMRGLWPN